jgi:pimeloyl-ACP methyl ester carboxylesterase
VTAVDPLGVGASSRPSEVDTVNLETMAAAAAEFVRQLRTLMAVGELASRLAPLEDVPLVAVGHSLGWLHAADVPAEVIAADDEQACAWPRQS